jgi:hypothetical protein
MRRRVLTLGMSAALLALALVGCAGEGDYVKRLHSPLAQERLQAILWLAKHGSEKVLPNLIDSLMDEDPTVRWAAAETLKERTGETLGYDAADPESRRGEATGRWKEWWKEHEKGQVPKPEGPVEQRTGGQQGEVTPGPGRSQQRTRA